MLPGKVFLLAEISQSFSKTGTSTSLMSPSNIIIYYIV